MKKITFWIEAMRLRTLPVSLAGIIAACALALTSRCFSMTAAILCLLFATLAQIASNFANEYYDFKAGLDAPGRDGPRRGVTEGDITPRAMKAATYGVLAAACAVGLAIAATAGWWLVGAGIIIALGVIAYSAGPFPLSRHGLGEIAVIFFFGIIPVNLTYYVMSGVLWMPDVFMTSLSIGLMGANVLIVNNYRDADADRSVGKKTLAVVLGRPTMSALYVINALAAVVLMEPLWIAGPRWGLFIPLAYVAAAFLIRHRLVTLRGAALNPLLGATAMTMALYSLGFLASVF